MLPPRPKITLRNNDNMDQLLSISCAQITNPDLAHLNIENQILSGISKKIENKIISSAVTDSSMIHNILNSNIKISNNSLNNSNLFGQEVLNKLNKVPNFHEGPIQSRILKDNISMDNSIIDNLKENLANNLNVAGSFVHNKFSNINENSLFQLFKAAPNDFSKLPQSIVDPQKSMDKLCHNELINLLANQTSKLLEQQISKQFSINNNQISYDNLIKEALQNNERNLEINSLLLKREINDRIRAIDDQNQFRLGFLKNLKSSNVNDDNLKLINLTQNLSSDNSTEAPKK